MRKKLLILLACTALIACKEDGKLFDVDVPSESISFEAIAGGAVMKYRLSGNSNVFAIKVTYTDAWGNEVVKKGSSLSRTLVLDGFTEARTNVPATISLVDYHDIESKTVEKTFSTLASGPVTFFENVKVGPYFGGISLSYDAKSSDGFAHLYYVGVNPLTNALDTLLVESFRIEEGETEKVFPLPQQREVNTIVIKTEDMRGFWVKQQVWKNVECYVSGKLDMKDAEILDPENIVVYSNEMEYKWQYLFDGDKTGYKWVASGGYTTAFTFVAGPAAVGKFFIVDLKKPTTVGQVRFYCPFKYVYGRWDGVLGNAYIDKVPSNIKIYASNNPDDQGSWIEIAHDVRGKYMNESSWVYRASEYRYAEEYATIDPAYIEIACRVPENPCRYYKIEVLDTFQEREDRNQNTSLYIAIQELEFYGKIN